MSVRRNTAYNFTGAVVPVLVTFVTLPVYLRAIGEERYGVLIVLWTLLGYFGLFDLGLGRAVTNRIAALGNRTSLEREQVFWTALLLNIVLGCIGALVLWAVGVAAFTYFIDAPSRVMAEVRSALPWMVLAFPLLLTTSVLSGALMGREEFLAQNAVGVATGVLIQVAPLVVALTIGPALPSLVIAVLAVRVLGSISLFGLCLQRLPVRLQPNPALDQIRPLFGYGGWVTVTSIVGPLLTTLDRVVIGVVAGASAVTYYTVPYSLASRLSILPGSLSSALFPRFSLVLEEERNGLLRVGVQSLVVVITPLVVLAMLVMEPFLIWWLGAEFAAEAAPVGEILVIGIWANCLAYLPFTFIQGEGRPDLVAKFHLAELLPYLVVLWVALEWKGAVGAALAWSVRVWVDAALMFWASRFRDLGNLGMWALALGVSVVSVALTDGGDWRGLIVRGAVFAGVAGFALGMAPDSLRNRARRLMIRLSN